MHERRSAIAALRQYTKAQLDQAQADRREIEPQRNRRARVLPDAYNIQGHNQMQEVRSGGSYISQSDLRLHFGLGGAKQCSLEIHWPSGQMDKIADAPVNKIVTIVEGKGVRA